MTTATARQRQVSSKELNATRPRSDAKRSEVLTKSYHESFKQHCARQITWRKKEPAQNQEKQPRYSLNFALEKQLTSWQ